MRRGEQGFTYLALLWAVAISGVMLAALGSQWRINAIRQREAELLFRGNQIQQALIAYKESTPPGMPTSPTELSALLEDVRQGVRKRHLRKLWDDPITGRPWGLLLNNEQRIVGVYSTSKAPPLTAPKEIDRYEVWKFDILTPTQGQKSIQHSIFESPKINTYQEPSEPTDWRSGQH